MMEHGPQALCYLEAEKVQGPAGRLAGMDVRSQDDKKLGTIDGVLIDAESRCVRYFVVSSHPLMRRRRYKVRADVPAHVDGKALTIEAPAVELPREEFDFASARRLSNRELEQALADNAAA